MSGDFPEPRLEHIFDLHADLEAPHVLPQTPAGTRQIWNVTGGRVEGLRIKGEILAPGGDWALLRSDGAIQLDVRATMKTDDGALIYTWYSGLIIMGSRLIGPIMSGEDVPLDEYYFYTNPMFQTAAPEYDWLNQVIAVGRGRVVPNAVEYRVWALRNP